MEGSEWHERRRWNGRRADDWTDDWAGDWCGARAEVRSFAREEHAPELLCEAFAVRAQTVALNA